MMKLLLLKKPQKEKFKHDILMKFNLLISKRLKPYPLMAQMNSSYHSLTAISQLCYMRTTKTIIDERDVDGDLNERKTMLIK